MSERHIRTLLELETEAANFVRALAPLSEKATLVLLSGELGAGKTAFTKAAAGALGVPDTVTSPTFVLEKIYALPSGPFKRLVHIDAYRLENGTDLVPLGFDEIRRDPGNLVFLEWPEKVKEVLPSDAIKISFTPHEDGSRTISYG